MKKQKLNAKAIKRSIVYFWPNLKLKVSLFDLMGNIEHIEESELIGQDTNISPTCEIYCKFMKLYFLKGFISLQRILVI